MPVARPARLTGRHPSSAGTVNAARVAKQKPAAPAPITGQTRSSAVGSGGG